MKEVSVIVIGYDLTTPVESPTSVTVYGRLGSLTFTNPICSESTFVIESQPKEFRFLTIYGKDLEVETKGNNTVVIKGDVIRIVLKDHNNKELKNMVILPCSVVLAQLLDENDNPL
jgi:hypothetical protein